MNLYAECLMVSNQVIAFLSEDLSHHILSDADVEHIKWYFTLQKRSLWPLQPQTSNVTRKNIQSQ